MRLFLDTNILLDVALKRLGHVESDAVVSTADQGHEFFLAWHSLSNVFYIVRKSKGRTAAIEFIKDVVTWATVAAVDHDKANKAIALEFADFEDGLQAAAAEACSSDLIITRNTTDFATSPVPVMTPEAFLAKHQKVVQPARLH